MNDRKACKQPNKDRIERDPTDLEVFRGETYYNVRPDYGGSVIYQE